MTDHSPLGECPAWCEYAGTGNSIWPHSCDVAEFVLDQGHVTVSVEKLTLLAEPRVNVHCLSADTRVADETAELDLVTADTLARILGHHPLGQALTEAVTLLGGVETVNISGPLPTPFLIRVPFDRATVDEDDLGWAKDATEQWLAAARNVGLKVDIASYEVPEPDNHAAVVLVDGAHYVLSTIDGEIRALEMEMDWRQRNGELAQVLMDLDRCEHGRHAADSCSHCPDGQSTGNLLLPPGTVIGTGRRSTKIVVPSPDRRRDPTAWRTL
ncbi:hypothetical protein [Microbispora bryophytorum]|uniref:Uncharacterized protein n=1 Tax=Microbispora bryophytorum subsp. camponoti TaxID=1677852 RepID=A0ABR8L832_9ACTN|nr:hypothetical protein [Microbispora camponoti]MBD3147080.1 hypothetical protein [Microbispora camponoti]